MKANQFDQENMLSADNVVYRNVRGNRTWNIDALLDEKGDEIFADCDSIIVEIDLDKEIIKIK